MRKGKATAENAADVRNTPIATMDRLANGLAEDLRDHARLMCDIIAIAFQTNKTRVASPFNSAIGMPAFHTNTN
jgi:hypothetical protein